MRTEIVIGIICGILAGCGESMPDQTSCVVPATSVVSFGDCHKKMPDGTECVTYCGQLPENGTPGTTLPDGCQVQIGTSTPETGTCVASCDMCP